MLSWIKSYSIYFKITVIFSFVFHMVYWVVFYVALKNSRFVYERYNEILLCLFVFTPFFSSFVLVPTLYDLYISKKKEMLHGVKKRILLFLAIDEIMYLCFTIVFFETVRRLIYKKIDIFIPIDYTIRLVLLIIMFQVISILFCLLMRNQIAIYGSLFIYMIVSLFLSQYGGVLFVKGYLCGTELGVSFSSFLINQCWKIVFFSLLTGIVACKFRQGFLKT